ncbi:MAG: D-2-hydroxyacid dehydrogenase family protein [Actinomycetota bacterium]
MPHRVVVLDDYQDVARRFGPWERLGDRIELVVVNQHVADDELVETLTGAAVVVAMRERTPFPRALLERLPDLKLLVTTGMANASIDIDAARDLGITVTGTGIPINPTSELTWGLILAVIRNIPSEDARVRDGGWQHTVGLELVGRTLGVIGLGRQGSRVAAIGNAFEMDVLAWSQNLDPDHARSQGVEPVTKDDLLERSDIVTLHLRLSDRTRGIIGATELARMKHTAYLINTSRGPLVDEVALLNALDQGVIAGAGIDVYDTEPLPPRHALRGAPNTVLTPHVGYVTQGTYEVFYTDAVEDIDTFLAGRPTRVLNQG